MTPSHGFVLEVKKDGANAMACESDPTFVETALCVSGEIPKVRKWVKPVLW